LCANLYMHMLFIFDMEGFVETSVKRVLNVYVLAVMVNIDSASRYNNCFLLLTVLHSLVDLRLGVDRVLCGV
jgi:hypothetical protein